MKVEILGQDRMESWDRFVTEDPNGTIFHRVAWRRVIGRSTGHRPVYLMALEGDRVRGVLPLFLMSTGLFGKLAVSLPYLNVGGILADSPEAELALAAESERIGHREGVRYVELRQGKRSALDLPVSERKVLSVIPLAGGAEAVFARLHQNVRNKIRKARKNQVRVRKAPEGLKDFYRIYSRNLRDLGTPVMPLKFFQEILAAFPDEAGLYVAERKGKAIGAKIVLWDQPTCYFIWSASLREELRYAPVHALNWAVIEEACAAGCREVDLGRSSAESSHQRFKKYWGVQVRPLPWTYQLIRSRDIPGLNPDNPKFAAALWVWRRLPVFLTRWIGPPLAVRLP